MWSGIDWDEETEAGNSMWQEVSTRVQTKRGKSRSLQASKSLRSLNTHPPIILWFSSTASIIQDYARLSQQCFCVVLSSLHEDSSVDPQIVVSAYCNILQEKKELELCDKWLAVDN